MDIGRAPPYVRLVRTSFDSADDVAAGAVAPSAGSAAAKLYVNPILDADFPDPTVIRAPDGYYYAYATQSLQDGAWTNIQVARSRDLIHWNSLGDAHIYQQILRRVRRPLSRRAAGHARATDHQARHA